MDDWMLRVLVYGAGDAINGTASLTSQIRRQLSALGAVATNRRVAALAQLDAEGAPSERVLLDPAGRFPVEQLPETDTGDPVELVGFVRWAADRCPARSSVLVLSGHGAAWQDGMVDAALGAMPVTAKRNVRAVPDSVRHPRRVFGLDVSTGGEIKRAVLLDGGSRDYLSNAELGAACDRITQDVLRDKLDVLVFDACLMSAWEVLHDVSGSVRAVVASIDEISAAGIDLAGPVADLSAPDGPGDHRRIASTIAGRFTPSAPFDTCVAIDLEIPAWTEAIERFGTFCRAVDAWLADGGAERATAVRHALALASVSIVSYVDGGLSDVRAFAEAMAAVPDLPDVARTALKQSVDTVSSCVLARSAGSDYRDATGLSVFAPTSATEYARNRPDYVRLRFAVDTGWSDVLDRVFGFRPDTGRFA